MFEKLENLFEDFFLKISYSKPYTFTLRKIASINFSTGVSRESARRRDRHMGRERESLTKRLNNMFSTKRTSHHICGNLLWSISIKVKFKRHHFMVMSLQLTLHHLVSCVTHLLQRIQQQELKKLNRNAQSSCNGADKTRGVRIHVQAFIKWHGQKHRQGRTTGKQVYRGQGRRVLR